MKELMKDLIEFQQAGDYLVQETPSLTDDSSKLLRINLISSEFYELLQAIDNDNLAKIADGLADLIYVIVGSAVSYGIDLPEVWKVVHEANMRKYISESGEKIVLKRSLDGKLQKPEGWKHPDISPLIENGKSIMRYLESE